MKHLSKLVAATCLLVSITSCKKENPASLQDSGIISNETVIIVPEMQITDGIMVFEDHEHLRETVGSFGKMTSEQRLNWSADHGFQSQQMLKDEMLKLQVEFEQVEYAGLDPDISVEEMNALGYQPKFNPTLVGHANRGLFIIHNEEDGTISFELTIQDKAIAHVINYEGYVIVEGDLYQYKDGYIKSIPYSSPSPKSALESASNTDTEAGIFVISDEDRASAFTVGNIFDQNCNCWIWYYNSSNERFYHYVYIHSYWNGIQNKAFSNYQSVESAEKKLFGIWIQRNNYKPIYTLDGTWNWKWKSGVTGYSWQFSSGAGSGMYFNYGHSYGEIEYLFPYGWSAIGILPGDEVQIYNMHIHGTFWGGCCGYHTNYYY